MHDDRSSAGEVAERRDGPLFDRIVVVDWSASSVPRRGRDSVWIAEVPTDRSTSVRTSNPPTRAAAMRSLTEMLADAIAQRRRTLLGVDFSLGFPRGVAEVLDVEGWAGMWRLLGDAVIDEETNRNNRFEVASALNRRFGPGPGPFWGCPPNRATEHLTPTKATCDVVSEWRAVEADLRASGWRPFSVWQLLGAGSVGSQSLLGIAALERLRRSSDVHVDVWPFTTGLVEPRRAGGALVVAEVWPTMFERSTKVSSDGVVRDERQVVATAIGVAELDRAGELGRLFTPPVPPGDRAAVVDEEGWMLWPK